MNSVSEGSERLTFRSHKGRRGEYQIDSRKGTVPQLLRLFIRVPFCDVNCFSNAVAVRRLTQPFESMRIGFGALLSLPVLVIAREYFPSEVG